MFLMPKSINLPPKPSSTPLDSIQQLIEALSIEELLQLLVKYFELLFKVSIIVAVPDSIDEFLASLEITGLGAPVQLVLQAMLDV